MLEVVLTNAFGEHVNKDTQVFDLSSFWYIEQVCYLFVC